MALRLRSGQAPFRPLRLAVALAVLVSLAFGLAAARGGSPAVHAAPVDVVTLAPGSAAHLAPPTVLMTGKRYAFTWPGGGPPQTFTIKSMRDDGWILVEVADETIKP